MFTSIAFLVALADPSATLRWRMLDTPVTTSLRGLCAVDQRVCFASGSGGSVLRTIDGEHFVTLPVPGAGALDFRDVHAFDAERALIVTAGAPAIIFRTVDGGVHWDPVYTHADPRAFFDGMAFWDDRHGMAFSDPIDGRLLVVVTDDAGANWRELTDASAPPTLAGEAGFAASGTSLCVDGAGAAWIGLGGGVAARVLRTEDGGSTWHASPTPLAAGASGAGIFSLARWGARRLIAVGGDYTAADRRSGNVAISDDRGAAWRAIAGDPPAGYRSCVAAFQRDGVTRLITVGPNGGDVSDDGGDSWRRFSTLGLHTVAVGHDQSVWASGQDGRIARLTEVSCREPAAAWDRFRGQNGSGIADDASYPADLAVDRHVVWQRDFPEGHSSPVLTASRVYLTGVEDERLFTYAVDRASGATLWRREAPRPRRTQFHAKNHAAAASAAVDEDVVVVFFDEYGVLAYDHDGTERWRVPLGPFNNVYGMGASPILVGDAVVLACDQSQGSFVLALHRADGGELWRAARPRAVSGHCTPIVRQGPAGAEVLLPGSFLLDAYDAASGVRRWWVNGLPSEMKSVPVLIGERLFVHGFASPLNNQGNQILLPAHTQALATLDADHDGRIDQVELGDDRLRRLFQFLDLDGDGSLDQPEWNATRDFMAAENSALAIDLGGAGDITAHAVRWRYFKSIPQLPSPLIYRGRYYLLNDQGGLLTVLDAATGEVLEKGRLEEAQDAYYASPIGADGKVYLLSETGTLSVLDAAGGLVPIHTTSFEDACYATPALDGGAIWLRTLHRLYCFRADG